MAQALRLLVCLLMCPVLAHPALVHPALAHPVFACPLLAYPESLRGAADPKRDPGFPKTKSPKTKSPKTGSPRIWHLSGSGISRGLASPAEKRSDQKKEIQLSARRPGGRVGPSAGPVYYLLVYHSPVYHSPVYHSPVYCLTEIKCLIQVLDGSREVVLKS
jgi:hypothetical protein